jgi:hypothetical protein
VTEHPVEVTVGVAEWTIGESPAELLSNADDALREAKRLGGARVNASEPVERRFDAGARGARLTYPSSPGTSAMRRHGSQAAFHGSVRLEAGAHSSPNDGVCVVELASVLAGEEFSDHPRCVCEVIAAFLRGWNDRSSHADRQRLLPYASRVIGTRGDRETTRTRRDACLAWAGADLSGGLLSRIAARLVMRLRILLVCGVGAAFDLDQGAAEYAARVTFARYGHAAAFMLLDDLVAIGTDPESSARPELNGHGRPGANGGPAGLEAASLAHPVAGPPQAGIPAARGELAGHPQVAQGEQNGQRQNGDGHAAHLGGGDAAQRDEEHVQRNGADRGDPEGDAKVPERLHASKVAAAARSRRRSAR